MGPDQYGAGGGHITSIAITAVIVIAVLLMRNRRARRLRLEAMWIRPLIYVALIGAAAFAAPPAFTPLTVASMALALVLGGALGWQRGRFTRIEVHPETHDITAQASVVGILFILALFAVRLGLRNMAYEIRGAPTAVITSSLILFVGAMMSVQSLEMFLRARRLLAEAQAAKAAPVSPGANPPIVR